MDCHFLFFFVLVFKLINVLTAPDGWQETGMLWQREGDIVSTVGGNVEFGLGGNDCRLISFTLTVTDKRECDASCDLNFQCIYDNGITSFYPQFEVISFGLKSRIRSSAFSWSLTENDPYHIQIIQYETNDSQFKSECFINDQLQQPDSVRALEATSPTTMSCKWGYTENAPRYPVVTYTDVFVAGCEAVDKNADVRFTAQRSKGNAQKIETNTENIALNAEQIALNTAVINEVQATLDAIRETSTTPPILKGDNAYFYVDILSDNKDLILFMSLLVNILVIIISSILCCKINA
eukprot:172321_1